ncbi:hypothetical protein J6590_016786 [Homalodisca vitripennis]|nr:hypothetical protein J6590_016786 [Homalodisca vitripennis]
MDSENTYTVEDILQILEGNTDTLLTATVYTEPPENFLQSDEDSANEEEDDINRLTGNQLRASAQLQATTLTSDGLDHISFGDPDIIVNNPIGVDLIEKPSTSSDLLDTSPSQTSVIDEANDQVNISNNGLIDRKRKNSSKKVSSKTQPCLKKTHSEQMNKKAKKGSLPTRKWEQVDIVQKPEHEWEMPDFINVDRTPTEFF